MRRSHTALIFAVAFLALCVFAAGLWLGRVAPEQPPLSGERTTRTVEVAEFDRVHVRGQWEVEITRGPVARVELSYPVELADGVTAAVEQRALELRHSAARWRQSADRNEDLRLTALIVMPELRGIESSGGSFVSFAGFTGRALEIDSSGVSRIEGADGRYDELEIAMSGAGAANLAGVTAADAHVELSGALTVTLTLAGGELSGDVSGASAVEYYGTVRAQRIDTSGVARVRQLD